MGSIELKQKRISIDTIIEDKSINNGPVQSEKSKTSGKKEVKRDSTMSRFGAKIDRLFEKNTSPSGNFRAISSTNIKI